MKNELHIKTAAEYAEAEASQKAEVASDLEFKATQFINNKVAPEIEDRIAHPEKYTSKGSTSFKVDHYPTTEFVTAVSKLLTPLGYTVVESHDGGGMYATIVIRWKA